ncbi:MAG TPA: hypothetical protein VKE22_21930 [Haliangiales bacterium]|nr:hypothetical protein [Haliangiales bacterium]
MEGASAEPTRARPTAAAPPPLPWPGPFSWTVPVAPGVASTLA